MNKSKRILPRKGKGKTPQFSREQILEAMAIFQQQGGMIEQLPPQRGKRRSTVGNHWESLYEPVFDQF